MVPSCAAVVSSPATRPCSEAWTWATPALVAATEATPKPKPSTNHGADGDTEAFRQKGQAGEKRLSTNDLLEVECCKERGRARQKGEQERDDQGPSQGAKAKDAKGN